MEKGSEIFKNRNDASPKPEEQEQSSKIVHVERYNIEGDNLNDADREQILRDLYDAEENAHESGAEFTEEQEYMHSTILTELAQFVRNYGIDTERLPHSGQIEYIDPSYLNRGYGLHSSNSNIGEFQISNNKTYLDSTLEPAELIDTATHELIHASSFLSVSGYDSRLLKLKPSVAFEHTTSQSGFSIDHHPSNNTYFDALNEGVTSTLEFLISLRVKSRHNESLKNKFDLENLGKSVAPGYTECIVLLAQLIDKAATLEKKDPREIFDQCVRSYFSGDQKFINTLRKALSDSEFNLLKTVDATDFSVLEYASDTRLQKMEDTLKSESKISSVQDFLSTVIGSDLDYKSQQETMR